MLLVELCEVLGVAMLDVVVLAVVDSVFPGVPLSSVSPATAPLSRITIAITIAATIEALEAK